MNSTKNTKEHENTMFKIFKELAIIPQIACDKLAVVVTYNRKEFIEKWLRAWNNAEHYGVDLAVVHTFDGERPEGDEVENILRFKPTFYIPIHNTILRDYGPLVMVLRNMAELPKWQHLFWFTDDMMPMRRSFLKPFVEKISKKNVGLVAQCYEPKTTSGGGGHIRTIAYATKREVTDRLKLPDPAIHKNDCGYVFEYKENHILQQVIGLGYKFELCHSDPESSNYQHWTSYLDWMWDCHLLGHWSEYWDVYEEQFNPIQKIDGCSGSTATIMTQGEIESRSLKPKKTTVILTTNISEFKKFSLCLVSILANTRNNHDIEEIIVNISGPDKKNQESILQDNKQYFLDIISCLEIGESKKKITVIRSWKTLTHGKMIEQAIAHVDTENYLVVQDNMALISDMINDEIINFTNESSIVKMWKKTSCESFAINDGWIKTPNTCSSLTLCKAPAMRESHASWVDYSVDMEFHVGNFVSHKKFLMEHQNLPDSLKNQSDKPFFGIDMPSGTFVRDKIRKNFSWFETGVAEDMNDWTNERFDAEVNKLCEINGLSEIVARAGLNASDNGKRCISTRQS